MEITIQDIKNKIEEADLVLIGIGDEFECLSYLNQDESYQKACDEIRTQHLEEMMPYVNVHFLKEKKQQVLKALENLLKMVENKNYFVVSTCMNDFLTQVGFREDRIVEPCGNYKKMQCKHGCENSIIDTKPEFLQQISECLHGNLQWEDVEYPVCEKCGEKMVFNSLYAEQYDENGYLDGWNTYMKWLQGTVNRKLCILELGVGLKYPSVIRWPFEKTGYLNKKANFIRVHERLYQLTPELKEQGYFIPQNAVDVLNLG